MKFSASLILALVASASAAVNCQGRSATSIAAQSTLYTDYCSSILAVTMTTSVTVDAATATVVTTTTTATMTTPTAGPAFSGIGLKRQSSFCACLGVTPTTVFETDTFTTTATTTTMDTTTTSTTTGTTTATDTTTTSTTTGTDTNTDTTSTTATTATTPTDTTTSVPTTFETSFNPVVPTVTDPFPPNPTGCPDTDRSFIGNYQLFCQTQPGGYGTINVGPFGATSINDCAGYCDAQNSAVNSGTASDARYCVSTLFQRSQGNCVLFFVASNNLSPRVDSDYLVHL